MNIPTITTSRLILRPFTLEDTAPLHRILGQEGVLQYFPSSGPPPQEKVEKLINGQLKHWEEHGYGWWGLEQRQQAGLMGWCGLQFLPETQEIEVGYLLGRDFWGQGFATEAAWASLQFGFEDLAMKNIIVGIVHPENIASQRVLEKLGMTFAERANYFGMDCYRYTLEPTIFAQQLEQG